MDLKKLIGIGLVIGFFILGALAMQRAMPEAKSKRIYEQIKLYSPYTFEKYIGGLAIVDKRDGSKEKPSSAEVLLRMDELDKAWGKEHLFVDKNILHVTNDKNDTVATILIKNEQERQFLHRFFGI